MKRSSYITIVSSPKINLEENILELSNFQTLLSSTSSQLLTESNKEIRFETCSISLSLRFLKKRGFQEKPPDLLNISINLKEEIQMFLDSTLYQYNNRKRSAKVESPIHKFSQNLILQPSPTLN